MTNPTILITGANRGLGLEFARQYAADGWQVIACCRKPDGADALNALADGNSAIEVHALDVTDGEQLKALAASLRGRPIDLLLSNAGIYGPRGANFGNVPAADWLQVFEVNSVAPLMLAQAFVDHVAAGAGKLIAVVSSKMGSIDDNGSGGSYIYRSSKTAVNQVVKSLSIDLAERGITVVTLHPGWVQTDMGGANAEITVEQSIAGMKAVLDNAGPDHSGKFIEHDGSTIPW